MRGVSAWLLNKEAPNIETISYLASDTLKQAYEEQSIIGWGHFLRGRLSITWGTMIRHEYAKLAKQTHTTKSPNKNKHRNPESWASGLILTNWDFVISAWESRIETQNQTQVGVQPINIHYFLLQKAVAALNSHNITNQFDKNLILRQESDIAKLSTNQLKLWLANFQTINQLNKLMNKTGTSEPTTNADTII